MNFLNRARLYIVRKKGKSILLLIILIILSCAVLTALYIKNAADSTQNSLRQKLGGELFISFDYSESNPYLKTETNDDGIIMYSTEQISPNLVEKIREIQGVRYCSATVETLVCCPDLNLFKGNIPIDDKFSQSTKIKGVWKSEENTLFTSGQLTLTQGRHINANDKQKILISEDLAQKNHLKVGDIITADKNIDMEIAGLFSPKTLESFNEQVTSYDKIQNLIIADLNTVISLENGPAIQGFNELCVSLFDPAGAEEITKEIQNIHDVDWQAFTITQNTEAYTNASEALSRLSALILTILIVLLITGTLVLSLILTMWSRTRIRETGILLSLGIKKISILGQYITEVLVIAAAAFALSCFPAGIMAKQTESLLNKAAHVSEISPENISLEVTVQPEEIGRLCVLGTGIVVLSTGIASISVMRLKPRDILSKMS